MVAVKTGFSHCLSRAESAEETLALGPLPSLRLRARWKPFLVHESSSRELFYPFFLTKSFMNATNASTASVGTAL
jgi:hypothetical protein